MTISNIYKFLDKMEIMVLKGFQIPLVPLGLINYERLIDLVDKIRASIPAEVQEAHNILKKRDEIFINAQNKANQIINDAQLQANALVNESEILKAVQAEAEKIRQEVIVDCENLKKQTQAESEKDRTMAINEAIHIREGADKYAETVLSNLDKDLKELHGIVKNGQYQLTKMRSEYLSNMTTQKADLENKEVERQNIDEYGNVAHK